MAGIARCCTIVVPAYPFMIAINRSLTAMFVANNATKYRKIGSRSMAFRAFGPFTFVFAAIYRKVL